LQLWRALDGALGMLGPANDEIVSNDKGLSSPVRVVAFLSPMDWKLGWKIEERNCAVLELLVTELLAGTVSPAGGDEFLSGLLSTLRPDTFLTSFSCAANASKVNGLCIT